MTALIYLTGIAVFALVIYLTLELAPATPTGRLAETLTPADGVVLNGWRRSLSPLDKPVSKWTPAGLLRQTRADLYWAQIGDRWNDWNEVQFTSLRVALAVAGFGLGMVSTGEPVFALIGGLVGFQYPAMAMGGIARRYRRLFISQLLNMSNWFLPRCLPMHIDGRSPSANFRRRAWQESGCVSVLQMAQGRDLIEQMQREAQEAHLPELIAQMVQLEFIRRGTAQQELMGQSATSIAADYLGSAEQRAEKVGSELVIPMVVFIFTFPGDPSGCHWLG